MHKYVFKPYQENFPLLFQSEKNRISSFIKTPVIIEHIGSTAIPGLGGKGIIDIAIASETVHFEDIKTTLEQIGYEYRPSFSTPSRLYFVAYLSDSKEGTRRYHIHLTSSDSSEWKEFLKFRDTLTNDSKKAKEYAEVKQQAALETDEKGVIYRRRKEYMFALTTQSSFPKKIMIFGIPGSGKSTFALKLSKIFNLPLFHLDKYFFIKNWKERNYEEFLEIQKELVEKETWIIDGNATQSLKMRFKHADLILYFRFNRLLCLWRIFKRRLFKNSHISDRAEGCSEKMRFCLIKYLWGYDKRVNDSVAKLIQTYPYKTFKILRNEKDLEALICELMTLENS